MKQRVFFIVLLFLLLSRPITQAQASCQIGPGKQFTTQVTFYGNKDNGSSIAVGSVTRFRPPAQCTTPIASNTYTISCDETTETLAADSIFPPLCGSGEERGKANSTCYQCGAGVIKCDGYNFTLGKSSSIFNNHQRCPFDENNPNWSGDVWCASKPDSSIFEYNGLDYKYNGELIVACGSNNQACGASEECVNRAHPGVNNRGNNGSTPEKECTTVTRTTSVANDTDINLNARGTPTDVTGIEARNLIDVGGDNDRGRGPQLSTLIGNSVNTSPDIKGLYQVNLNDGKTPIPKDVENGGNFGVTLLELGTNSNDIIRAPKIGYDIGGGYNYTILYASQNDITIKGTLEDNAVYGYTIHLTDFNINPDILTLYNQNQDAGRNQLLAIPCGYPLGTPKDSRVKVAVADTGTFMDPRVRKDWWNVPADVSCANTSPGLVTPLPTQICTEFGVAEAGVPDITTKVPIPNLASFGIKGTDKQGNSFLAGLKDFSQRPISGILGFQGSKAGKPVVDEPSVFKSLGMQLDRALPFLTPLAINVQPIVQEYSHTATSTLCFESDNGNKQAFPIKERIIIPAPGLNKLRQNGRMLAGFVAPNVSITKGEYEHLGELNPATLGSIRFNPTCDEPPSARIVHKTVVPTTEAEKYEVPLDKLPIYFLEKWINKVLSIVGKKCTETNCDADANPSMNAHIKIKTPKIREILMDTTNDPSGKPVGALATLVPGSFYFPNEHGKVSGQTIEQSVGSNSEDIKPVNVNYFGAYTMDVYNRFTNCAIRPGTLQKDIDYSCNFSENATGVPNTSDWAGTAGTRSGPPAFTPSGPFYELLVQKAEKYDVPQCVMEGVGRIEGGGRYEELAYGECVKTVNNCSAVGPMQFTIGPNPASDCTKCAAGYCPNAWSTWGKGGNPCRYEDSLDAAARYLAAFGNFSSGDQKQSIHDATTAYYGSDKDATARANLGGCEYWEFVYKQCNPSYVCSGGNVGL